MERGRGGKGGKEKGSLKKKGGREEESPLMKPQKEKKSDQPLDHRKKGKENSELEEPHKKNPELRLTQG